MEIKNALQMPLKCRILFVTLLNLFVNITNIRQKIVKKQTNCEKLRKKETSIIKDVFV